MKYGNIPSALLGFFLPMTIQELFVFLHTTGQKLRSFFFSLPFPTLFSMPPRLLKLSLNYKNVAIAFTLATLACTFYLYRDPRHLKRRLLQRLCYLITKRDLNEAHLERALLAERKLETIWHSKRLSDCHSHSVL